MDRITVEKSGLNIYYICKDNETTRDENMAKWLDLKLKEYTKILERHNAIRKNDECFFETYEDCEACIEFLQPWIVMKLLIE